MSVIIPNNSVPLYLIKYLPKFIVDNLNEKNISTLFPVQTQVLPYILVDFNPCDVIVCAPTGSGKTLSYAIPIVVKLHKRVVPRVRALVLVPNRNLVQQVNDVFEFLIKHTNLRVACLYGEHDINVEKEMLSKDVDIIIATPGRFMSHLSSKYISLSHLQFLVVDEADRLLDQSYYDWLPNVLESIYENEGEKIRTFRNPPPNYRLMPYDEVPLQKMILSATMTCNSNAISTLKLHSTLYIHSDEKHKYSVPDTLREFYCFCRDLPKAVALVSLIQSEIADQGFKGLCFTNSIESTHRLFFILNHMLANDKNIKISEYSSSLSQKERDNIVSQLKSGSINLVICSDAMARGMDISDVDMVFNYDAPSHKKTYIHRVGRTARAGKNGKAITLLLPEEYSHFKGKMDKIGRTDKNMVANIKIRNAKIPALKQTFENALKLLKSEITHQPVTEDSNDNDNNNKNENKVDNNKNKDKSESSKNYRKNNNNNNNNNYNNRNNNNEARSNQPTWSKKRELDSSRSPTPNQPKKIKSEK